MAYPNEVPDDQKEGDHLVPVDKWPEIRAQAEANAAKYEHDDIEIPDDDEDDPVEAWPDEVARDETLDGSRR